MNTRIVKFTWLLVFPFLFSCKGDQCGSPLPVPVISFTEPVYEGDDLVLSARGNDEHIYTWQGPREYSGTGRVQIIKNVQVPQSGNYTVTVSKEDCSGVSNTAQILVEPLPVPCLPSENMVRFKEFESIPIIDGSPYLGVDSTTGRFRIIASSVNGTLQITFPDEKIPEFNRSYTTVIGSPNRDQVEAMVSTGFPDVNTYSADNGRIYIRYHASGFYLVFCDLQFKREGTFITGNALLNCRL